MNTELPPLRRVFFGINGTAMQHEPVFTAASIEARERILLARIAELEADAERYRWLRDEAPVGIGEMASVRNTHSAQELDAAIDAARGKE